MSPKHDARRQGLGDVGKIVFRQPRLTDDENRNKC